jgi:hypothetical protein
LRFSRRLPDDSLSSCVYDIRSHHLLTALYPSPDAHTILTGSGILHGIITAICMLNTTQLDPLMAILSGAHVAALPRHSIDFFSSDSRR